MCDKCEARFSLLKQQGLPEQLARLHAFAMHRNQPSAAPVRELTNGNQPTTIDVRTTNWTWQARSPTGRFMPMGLARFYAHQIAAGQANARSCQRDDLGRFAPKTYTNPQADVQQVLPANHGEDVAPNANPQADVGLLSGRPKMRVPSRLRRWLASARFFFQVR